MYRPAIESQLQKNAKFNLAYTGTTPNDGLMQQNIHHFIEFPTSDVVAEFPPRSREWLKNRIYQRA
jgi:hypothetical protein